MTLSTLRRGRLGLLLLCASWAVSVTSWCRAAGAEEALRVIVLEPESRTPLESELVNRLQGELGAAGYDVIALERDPGTDPAQAVQSQGAELDAVGAFAVQERPSSGSSPASLILWFSDRVEGDQVVQEAQIRDGSIAGTLAVQGFELLSARVAKRRLPPPPPRVVAPERPRAAPPAPRAELSIFVSAALLYEPASGGAALSPKASVVYAPASVRGEALELSLRLSALALGTPTVIEAAQRRADVFQSFGLFEAVVALRTGSWLRPFGALGAAVWVVRVNGIGSAPSAGRTETTASPAGAAGLGLDMHLSRSWRAQVEAHGLLALRAAAVELDDVRAATFGRPLIVSSFGLGYAW